MYKTDETYRDIIIKKISDMPEPKLQEILDFIDFLRSKIIEEDDSILKVAGCLSGDALTSKDIEEELL